MRWNRMERNRQASWHLRLSAIGIGVLVGLLAVEAVLRVREFLHHDAATGFSFGAVFEFCASRHHRLIPNGSYRHATYEFDYLWANNSLGMRDREHSLHKPPGTFRVLALGDSIIQGHGVRLEDTVVTQLEARLNEPKRTEKVEILNGGVFGYSPYLEYLYLHEVIDSIEPDLVVVGFFLGNDVGEDYYYTQKAHFASNGDFPSFDDRDWPWSLIVEALDRGADLPARHNAAGMLQVDEWWELVKDVFRHSRTVILLKSRVIDPLTYPARREREFALVRQRRGDIRYDLGLVNYPVLTKDERLRYWEISEKYLEKISTLCREHAARMILLVIPPVERLNGETDFDEPYQILDDFGRRLSIPVVQLLPDLLHQDPYALYFKFDRHWTPEGNRFAAQILDRELRRLGVLPGESKPGQPGA